MTAESNIDQDGRDEFFELCQKKLERLQLTVVGKENISFPSKIHSINIQDDHMFLTLKKTRGVVVSVEVGDKLDFTATLSNGQPLNCHVLVKKLHVSEDPTSPSLIRATWPLDYGKKQLRRDVRIKTAIRTYYADALNSYGRIQQEVQCTGVIADLSKGGAFILTHDKVFYKGQDIFLFLFINDGDTKISVLLPSKVVHVKPVGKSKAARCQGMAVAFSHISKDVESTLINWIYSQQRKMLAERVATRKGEVSPDEAKF